MINAFHPDYMKTHEPDFMKSFRTHEANRKAAETLAKFVEKKRKVNPAYGYVHGIKKVPILTKGQQSMSMAEVQRELALKPRVFHTYSKAGVK